MMHWGYGGWSVGGMMVGWWLFWIVVVGAVVWIVSRRAGGRSDPRETSPEEIVKQRYARGEMGRDEYERRLADVRR